MKPTLAEAVGNAIRQRRSALGFSQEAFADRIAMHRTYFGAIERGEKNLQIDTLQKVCRGLQSSMWEILKDAESD